MSILHLIQLKAKLQAKQDLQLAVNVEHLYRRIYGDPRNCLQHMVMFASTLGHKTPLNMPWFHRAVMQHS